jgi:predicted dinucleotide-binding enzyme
MKKGKQPMPQQELNPSADNPHLHTRRTILQAAALAGMAVATGPLTLAATTQPAAPGKIKLGIIGSGRVGSALGSAWVKAGHEVMFSSQHLENDKELAAKLGKNAHAGTPREAAAFGTVLLIAVPYTALAAVGKDLGEMIRGKIVIDACNPIVARDGEMATAARERGVGLVSIEALPGARIVRAFNAIQAAKMGDATANTQTIGMPMAGDDAAAISVVSDLVREVGYEPVLVGTLAGLGKYLMPGTPLAGEHSPAEIRTIAAGLK